MRDEIFGPVLPVLTYENVGEALSALNERDKPLALYIYANNADLVEQVIAESSSGSVCVNHNAVQLAVPGLPFGGVGASGMGAYNGQAGLRHLQPRQVGAPPARTRRASPHVPALYPGQAVGAA